MALDDRHVANVDAALSQELKDIHWVRFLIFNTSPFCWHKLTQGISLRLSGLADFVGSRRWVTDAI